MTGWRKILTHNRIAAETDLADHQASLTSLVQRHNRKTHNAIAQSNQVAVHHIHLEQRLASARRRIRGGLRRARRDIRRQRRQASRQALQLNLFWRKRIAQTWFQLNKLFLLIITLTLLLATAGGWGIPILIKRLPELFAPSPGELLLDEFGGDHPSDSPSGSGNPVPTNSVPTNSGGTP